MGKKKKIQVSLHAINDHNNIESNFNANHSNNNNSYWSKEEDEALIILMKKKRRGPIIKDWNSIARERYNGKRTGDECNTRWVQYLKPGVKKGQWKASEDAIVI